MTDGHDFGVLRREIEDADEALVRALEARARAVRALGELRNTERDSYHQWPRDEDVLARARERIDVFPALSIEPVMREVLAACASLVAPLSVAFFGPSGSFCHLAARRRFGAPADLRPVDSIAAVLEEVERDRATFGVVPFETSSDGALTATLLGLAESQAKVCGELTLPVSYHLFSQAPDLASVRKVYGAAHAIAACERFLRTHVPEATLIDVASGDIAARHARDDVAAAAVANDMAAETFGLAYLRQRIEDMGGVETRFAIVGRDLPSRTGTDRTVVALAVHDAPGALHVALQPFADRGINLTRVESRPVHGAAYRYLFFLELDGHVTDRPVVTAIEQLRGLTRQLKVLGSYPRPTS